MAANLATRRDDGFRRVLGLLDSLRIRLAVDELQRVGGNYFGVQFFAVAVIEEFLQSIVGADAKVIIAMHANL